MPVDRSVSVDSVPLSFDGYMANTKSAAKRARQTLGRTLRNKSVLTALKRQQKKFAAAIASGDKQKSQVELALFASRLDKAAKRGTVHSNLADRRKSRATKLVNALQGKEAPIQQNAVAGRVEERDSSETRHEVDRNV